jgi:hypothetical protein
LQLTVISTQGQAHSHLINIATGKFRAPSGGCVGTASCVPQRLARPAMGRGWQPNVALRHVGLQTELRQLGCASKAHVLAFDG